MPQHTFHLLPCRHLSTTLPLWDLSIPLCVHVSHSLSLPYRISLCEDTTMYTSIQLLMGICVVSNWGLCRKVYYEHFAHVFLWKHIFISLSGTARSQGRCMSNFTRNCQFPLPPGIRCPIATHPRQHLVFIFFFKINTALPVELSGLVFASP